MPRKRVQLDIFDQPTAAPALKLDGLDWPLQERFPLNIPGRRIHVRSLVLKDLQASQSPLIVAGYASIDHLVSLLADMPREHRGLRILLGTEPSSARAERYGSMGQPIDREIEAYWLERGISARYSLKLIQAIERLESGAATARYLGDAHARLHAKIYLGSEAVTLGSSNFTQPGLVTQLEANARFTAANDAARYREAASIAENFWVLGTDATPKLIELLRKLLRWVGWQEALARACAVLLEGEWAKDYLDAQPLAGDQPLWPSQKQGIAQALWILETVGSVLVSDATGSGKTRLGAHLLRAAIDRIWRQGRVRRGRAVVVAPPSVAKGWQEEATRAGAQLEVRSHGRLSRRGGGEYDEVVEAVRRAQILAVDEAHNFLNRTSQRSQVLLGNMADHTVLFTATPINKSAVDLLRLADVLGADNLDPETVAIFEQMLRRPGRVNTLTEQQLEQLRTALQRFTVRRTKKMLNDQVDLEPEKYRDIKGRQCRYPTHVPKTYPLHEADQDKRLAERIRSLAESLIGVAFVIQPIELPEALRREGWTEEKFLQARLTGVRKLCVHIVMSALRSSRCALVEHLSGTEAALRFADLPRDRKRQATGDVIGKLRSIAGDPPGSRLTIEVPDWMTDAAAHRQAAEADRLVYEEILSCAQSISSRREMQKTSLIRDLGKSHRSLVAFDSRPITLAVLARHLERLETGLSVLIATGERGSVRREVGQRMRRGASDRGRLVALCSDAMSEGVNLQEASCVVHLDMPSVVRIAEQRVGRVDRMDSPHDSIEIWWPQDAKEFALRSDERFLERHETVENLLGSNLPLPPSMASHASQRRDTVVATEDLIEEYESADRRPWDGIEDAFAPVRNLVSGTTSLVPAETYAHYREVTARVLSRVSAVQAERRWALLCFSGSSIGAPRWTLVQEGSEAVSASLDEICKGLRERLGPDVRDLEPSPAAIDWFENAVARVRRAERDLLPRRKQIALVEMHEILRRYRADCQIAGEFDNAERIGLIVQSLEGGEGDVWVDWDQLAERWLDLIRPVWYEALVRRRGRSRPLLLADIRAELLGPRKLEVGRVLASLVPIPTLAPLDERLAACILGIRA